MASSYVVINFMLYLFAAYFYWQQRRTINMYLMVVSLYMVTAFLCMLYFNHMRYPLHDIQIFPFLYLFGVLMIFFAPLRDFNMEEKTVEVNENEYIILLAVIYIIIGFVDIGLSLSDTIARFQDGNWGALRNQLDEGGEGIEYYSSQTERLVKNLNSYLSPFAFVYAFFQLTKEKINPYLTIPIFIAIIGPSFMAATVEASRGMVMNLAMKLGIAYFLFKDFIPVERKKYIYWASLGLIIGFLFYSIAVTRSRFGDDEAGNSLFSYFGHSMLYFNDGIFNNLHDYAWGKRFFSWFIDLFGGDSYFNSAKAGATHGTAFYTIVGGIFIDWGPFGTIIAAILAAFFIRRWFIKDTLYLSDFIMIVFYISTLAGGIFVFGSGRSLVWVMTFVVYLIVKKLENSTEYYG